VNYAVMGHENAAGADFPLENWRTNDEGPRPLRLIITRHARTIRQRGKADERVPWLGVG
jgi:hypothetical protein